jgi:hypothetical protein
MLEETPARRIHRSMEAGQILQEQRAEKRVRIASDQRDQFGLTPRPSRQPADCRGVYRGAAPLYPAELIELRQGELVRPWTQEKALPQERRSRARVPSEA